jgi:hypothetical protein
MLRRFVTFRFGPALLEAGTRRRSYSHQGTGEFATSTKKPETSNAIPSAYCLFPPTAIGSLQPYRIAIKRSPKQSSAPTVIAAEDEA